MKNRKLTSCLLLNAATLVTVVADRVLKIYFLKNPAISLGGDFFYGLLKFNFAQNSGIAFGLPAGRSAILFLTCVVMLILAYEIIKAYRTINFMLITALTFILFGAVANLADRLQYGFVIDYIDVKYFTIFNLADSLITIGSLSLLWFLVKQAKLDKSNKVA